MTSLERAATRVAACLMDAPVDPSFGLADVNGWTQDKAYEIARAVLMAVRRPDGNLADALYESEGDNVRVWTDGIDAILADRGE